MKPSQSAANSERELTEQRAMLLAVLETAVDAIITISKSGRIESFNQAAERIFGWTAAEVIGSNVSMLMPSPYREQHDDYLHNYLETGIKKIIGIGREIVAVRKDGTVFPIDLAVSEVHVGRRHSFTALIRDVSERKRVERKLQERDAVAHERGRLADIGAIAAKIVHDLGNPLAGLMMQTQLALRSAQRGDPVGKIAEMIEQILASSRHLEAIVRDFREFAREQKLGLQEVDLLQFVHEVRRRWADYAMQSGISVQVIVQPPKLPPLIADELKLHRVMDNLVKNAIEAIQGPGMVTLQVELLDHDRVMLSVIDTGAGIAENVQLFQLFETTKPSGTGLGLAVCKQIVQAHGGNIRVEARQPHGTAFHLELPMQGPCAT